MAGQPLRTPSGENAGQPWRSSLDALEAALAEAARAITELRFSLEEGNTADSGPVAVPDGPAANEKSERLTDIERVTHRLESESAAPSKPVTLPDDPAANEKSERVSQRLESESAAPSKPVALPDDPAANEKSERLTDIERVSHRLESESAVPSGPVAVPDDPAANEKSERLTEFERVWQRLEREREEPPAARAEEDHPNEPSGPSEPSEPRGLDLLLKEYLMTIENRDASVDLIMLQRGLLTLAPMENIRLVTYAKGVPVISLRVEGELDLERLSEAVGNATGRRCEVIPQDGTKLFLRLTPDDDQEEAAT